MTSLVLSRSRPDDPRGGAALRNWQNIRALSRLGPVDVVSIGVDAPVVPIAGVREWVAFPVAQPSRWARACGGWLVRRRAYPAPARFHSRAATRWIRRRVADSGYDVVVIEGIVLASYMADLRRLGCRLVFDAHNVESALCADALSAAAASRSSLRRLQDIVVRRRVAAVEQYAVTTADLVWACSERDAVDIRARFNSRSPVAVVPNGVDVDAYRRPQHDGPSALGDDWAGQPITLVYPGLFSYGPNEEAALRLVDAVLPAVRARGYEARVILAGRDPTPAMCDRAQRDPAITVTGAFESVVPILRQPCVVTLPIAVGSGTRLKIVEAFAAASPVVTTAKGAEGLSVVDGEHLLIREEPEAIADGVIELWWQPERRRRLCERAYALACDRYSWSAAAEAIAASVASISRTAGAQPSIAPAEAGA